MSWLESALDYGITEADFWEMTLAELERAISSKKRIKKQQDQERAAFDYILADLIGRSVARIYSSSAKLPEITEVYTTLFDNQGYQEKKQEQLKELSALRFKQFAQAHNKKFNKEVGKENDARIENSNNSGGQQT
jgi:hypothetical protein